MQTLKRRRLLKKIIYSKNNTNVYLIENFIGSKIPLTTFLSFFFPIFKFTIDLSGASIGRIDIYIFLKQPIWIVSEKQNFFQ